MKILRNISIIALASTLGLTACKKDFLDRKPTGQAALEDVFTTVSGARSAVNGIHRMMYEFGGGQHYEFGQPSINMMFDLMGEDFIQNGQGHFNPVYNWNCSLGPSATGSYMWSFYFRIINNANFIITNVDKVVGDQADKDEIKAQALFYRAYAYYNLANCYSFSYKFGETITIAGNNGVAGYNGLILGSPCVPLYFEPTQVAKPRATVDEVFKAINSDLNNAIALFDGAGITRSDKSQINGNVARGLAARVALVMQDWPRAVTMAHDARTSFSYMNSSQALLGFNDINNNEWMWGSAINAEQATSYASYLSFMDRQAGGYALIHCQMVGNTDIVNNWTDTNDVRRKWWVTRAQVSTVPDGDSFYLKNGYKQNEQVKFKLRVKGSWVADYPLMRAGEMALIEAEGLAQQSKLADAKTVLDEFVKTRKPLFSANAANADTLIKQIWRQRRIELWGEGFRYSDIKRQSCNFSASGGLKINGLTRTNNVGPIGVNFRLLSPNDNRFMFRIPGSEVNQNKGLLQNL